MTHWLKQRREILKITQDQLAERLCAGGMNITKAAISKWELGKASLPLQTTSNRHLLAHALELTIPELLALDGYEIAPNPNWSHETRLIAALVETLSPEDRETILVMVNHLKSKNTTSQPSRKHSPTSINPLNKSANG